MTTSTSRPSQEDIDAVLAFYDKCLSDAFDEVEVKDEAIEEATQSVNNSVYVNTFVWVVENEPKLIWDIDETYPEGDDD